MAEWAYFAESTESDDEPSEHESADVESLEARRLSRWLKSMFGGSPKDQHPEEEDPENRER